MVKTLEGPSLLRIDNVYLRYGDKVILRDVCAEVKEIVRSDGRGQIVGFLGPSGIGKTCLFRIIAGLNQPTCGQVVLNGGIPVHPGLVGVVAQNYPLFEHRTVLSNLMLAVKRKEKNHIVASQRVHEYLVDFELYETRNHYPAQLSGGQRQRAAILQQVLCSDHFLLMDEPFSGLDLLMLEKTAALIQKVANMDDLNTIIIVSHDVTAVASVSDHIWMLGRERDAKGDVIPGARIMQVYDLVEMDLCWHPEIITTPRFMDFVRMVKEQFRTL